MDGAGDQFFSGAAFAGDQDAAGLRRDSLDKVEDGAHLRTLADDVVETGEAAQFATKIAGFFLPLQGFGDFVDGAAELIDELVVLDDEAVGAGIDGGDGGFDGGDAGDQEEEGIGCDFLGELEEIDAGFAGHADVGNDDVEDLGFEFALGFGNVVGDFDAIAFLAESDFEELADGALVVNDEDVGFAILMFRGGFGGLHDVSPYIRRNRFGGRTKHRAEMGHSMLCPYTKTSQSRAPRRMERVWS